MPALVRVSAPHFANRAKAFEKFLLPLPGELGARLGPLLGAGRLALAAELGMDLDTALALLAPARLDAVIARAAGRWHALLRTQSGGGAHGDLERILSKVPAGVFARREGDQVLLATHEAAFARLADALAIPVAGADAAAALVAEVDLSGLRAAFAAPPDALWKRLDGGGRVLVGAVAAFLDRARSAHFALHLEERAESRRVRAELRFQPDAAFAEHPAHELTVADPVTVPPLPANALLRVVLPRTLTPLFAATARVLGEDDAAKLASSRAIFDALLGGRSLQDDLLPALGPLTLWVLDTATGEGPRPRITLPGFAISAPLRDPKGARLLARLFDNLAVVQLAERAQSGRPVFRARRELVDGLDLKILERDEHRGPGAPPTEIAFTPTLLAAHGHAILASTRACALELARLHSLEEREQVVGDEVLLRGAPIAKYLRANHAVLALQRALDEGEAEADAAWFAGALADFALAFPEVRLSRQGPRFELTLTRAPR